MMAMWILACVVFAAFWQLSAAEYQCYSGYGVDFTDADRYDVVTYEVDDPDITSYQNAQTITLTNVTANNITHHRPCIHNGYNSTGPDEAVCNATATESTCIDAYSYLYDGPLSLPCYNIAVHLYIGSNNSAETIHWTLQHTTTDVVVFDSVGETYTGDTNVTYTWCVPEGDVELVLYSTANVTYMNATVLQNATVEANVTTIEVQNVTYVTNVTYYSYNSVMMTGFNYTELENITLYDQNVTITTVQNITVLENVTMEVPVPLTWNDSFIAVEYTTLGRVLVEPQMPDMLMPGVGEKHSFMLSPLCREEAVDCDVINVTSAEYIFYNCSEMKNATLCIETIDTSLQREIACPDVFPFLQIAESDPNAFPSACANTTTCPLPNSKCIDSSSFLYGTLDVYCREVTVAVYHSPNVISSSGEVFWDAADQAAYYWLIKGVSGAALGYNYTLDLDTSMAAAYTDLCLPDGEYTLTYRGASIVDTVEIAMVNDPAVPLNSTYYGWYVINATYREYKVYPFVIEPLCRGGTDSASSICSIAKIDSAEYVFANCSAAEQAHACQDPCQNSCIHGSTCIVTDKATLGTCDCSGTGYYGERCQYIDLNDDCQSNPCNAWEDCADVGIFAYECTIKSWSWNSDFTGTLYDVYVDWWYQGFHYQFQYDYSAFIAFYVPDSSSSSYWWNWQSSSYSPVYTSSYWEKQAVQVQEWIDYGYCRYDSDCRQSEECVYSDVNWFFDLNYYWYECVDIEYCSSNNECESDAICDDGTCQACSSYAWRWIYDVTIPDKCRHQFWVTDNICTFNYFPIGDQNSRACVACDSCGSTPSDNIPAYEDCYYWCDDYVPSSPSYTSSNYVDWVAYYGFENADDLYFYYCKETLDEALSPDELAQLYFDEERWNMVGEEFAEYAPEDCETVIEQWEEVNLVTTDTPPSADEPADASANESSSGAGWAALVILLPCGIYIWYRHKQQREAQAKFVQEQYSQRSVHVPKQQPSEPPMLAGPPKLVQPQQAPPPPFNPMAQPAQQPMQFMQPMQPMQQQMQMMPGMVPMEAPPPPFNPMAGQFQQQQQQQPMQMQQPMEMTFCGTCGHRQTTTDMFCGSCGSPMGPM